MASPERGKIRALFARAALDGHDRGVISVISRCRDEGMEIIYIYFYDPKEVAIAAAQESVDVIGITSSIGQHIYTVTLLKEALAQIKIDIPIIVGGVIPACDTPKLKDIGVEEVFGPGSSPSDASRFMSQLVAKRDVKRAISSVG